MAIESSIPVSFFCEAFPAATSQVVRGETSNAVKEKHATHLRIPTRREVWNVIERAKAGRVIILTTHSMEEAGELATQSFTMVNYSYSHQVRTYVRTTLIRSYLGILSLAAAVIPPLSSTPTPTLIPTLTLTPTRAFAAD